MPLDHIRSGWAFKILKVKISLVTKALKVLELIKLASENNLVFVMNFIDVILYNSQRT